MILRAVKRSEESPKRSDIAVIRCDRCDTQYDIFLDSGLMLQVGDETTPALKMFVKLFDFAIKRDHIRGHQYQKYICDGRSAFPM